jgi:hypothetical protein
MNELSVTERETITGPLRSRWTQRKSRARNRHHRETIPRIVREAFCRQSRPKQSDHLITGIHAFYTMHSKDVHLPSKYPRGVLSGHCQSRHSKSDFSAVFFMLFACLLPAEAAAAPLTEI